VRIEEKRRMKSEREKERNWDFLLQQQQLKKKKKR
jgi:hypothetical protein